MTTQDEKDKAWDKLQDLGINEQTLQIVTSINGYSLETMESILYAHLGYRSFEQYEYERKNC